MAAMSVIGIDFGNESCYIAVAKAGGIETIANDYSLRATPSYVAFSDKNRILGVAAKNQQVTNMKNTVYGLKRLIGRKFNDPHVKKELQMLPYSAVPASNGDIRIKVNYLNEEQHFSPEQCVAMLFTKLKDVSATALQTPVNDCVISVPSYYTNNERKALLDAASIAGLNVLRLFNETTATALSYGIYKQDLPGPDEKPRNVIFVDCGHSSLQVSACAFNKGKLKMLASSADRDLGGRDIDYILALHMAKEFQAKYKIDAKTNARAFVRLLAEIERVKKQMSANSTTLPVNIECFMEDKDVHGEIRRVDMENLCENFFLCVENTLMNCLKKSGLAVEEIYAVEVVGGSTRTPRLKTLIEKVYGKVPSTTLNQDESVSRGCALQCAMLSPAVRVRDFSVSDVQSYPIVVSWDAGKDNSAGEVEAFPQNHAVPFSRLLTFYKQEPFYVTSSYAANAKIPYLDSHIGSWLIKDVKPDHEGKAQKIKVKVRINLNGIMTVSSASMMELKDSRDEGDQSGAAAASSQSAMDTTGDATNEPTADEAAGNGNATAMDDEGSRRNGAGVDEEENSGGVDGQIGAEELRGKAAEEGDDKNKKKKTKSVDLTIETNLPGYTQSDINNFLEQELKMIAADRQEKERADARNALEEYVYELRSKLSSAEDLGPFLLAQDREQLVRTLDDTESWLYDDGSGGGEDCPRHVYQGKLSELKSTGEPIQLRKVEWELRPAVMEGFEQSVQLADKILGMIRSGDPKYGHLTDSEVGEVEKLVVSALRYLEETRQKVHAIPKHMACPITVAQIRAERQSFDNATKAILNKPPPKAPSPPKDTKDKPEEHKPQEEYDGGDNNKPQPDDKNKSGKDEKMDTS